MAFIPEVPYEAAEPTLRESCDKIWDVLGFLPHFWQAQGTRPETVRASLGLWAQIYRSGGALTGVKRGNRSRRVGCELELLEGFGNFLTRIYSLSYQGRKLGFRALPRPLVKIDWIVVD